MHYTLLKLLCTLLVMTAQVNTQAVDVKVDPPVLSQEETWVQEVMSEMNLPDKIGQMIISGIDGKTLSDDEFLMINSGQVGGVIFLGHNVKSTDQFNALVDALPQNTDIPLFLSVDQEGGRVQRLPLNKSDYPAALSIGKTPEAAHEHGLELGLAVQSFNLNLNLAPVLDVFSNPKNKVIGNRSFGRTPETVSFVGVDVMQGIQESGTISCVKHFPGHGDTVMDSHEGLPVIHHDVERLESFEWLPFRRAIENGADMIMTAHVLIPSIDAHDPATLSEEIISGYLREQMGFDGVVITDDLVMGAISKKYPYEVAVRKAVDAGVDIMLISNNNYVDEIQHALYTAVQNKEIDIDRIDKTVERILKLKYKYLVEHQDLKNDIGN